MLRLSIFCLLAGAAFAGVVDWGVKTVPRMPYTLNLRLVDQAAQRLYQNLATTQPDVRDTKFHYLLVAATVNRLGKRLFKSNDTPNEALKYTLNKELPDLYRNLVNASLELRENADKARRVLLPLRTLKLKYCGMLDDKDCDTQLEYQVQQRSHDYDVQRAVNVLAPGAAVARSYLDLHEDMLEQGKGRLSLRYLLDNQKPLMSLGQKHADTLKAYGLLQNDKMMKSSGDRGCNNGRCGWFTEAMMDTRSAMPKIDTMV